jgi:hypothetical protein
MKRVESKSLDLFFTIVAILLFLQIGIVTIVGAIESILKVKFTFIAFTAGLRDTVIRFY